MISSQRGFITLDFIFATLIGFSMCALLFAMTMTLTVAEITQYVTYSAARAQVGANKDPDEQELAARNKYDKLINSPVFAPLYKNGWFEVSGKSDLEVRGGMTGGGSQGSFKDDYPSNVISPEGGSKNRSIWTGVRTKFTAKILSMKLPMLGRTTEDDAGLSTRIATILIREPSQVECQRFMSVRYQQILKLDNRFNNYGSQQSKYLPMEDNGC
jgi:hypothetical protein